MRKKKMCVGLLAVSLLFQSITPVFAEDMIIDTGEMCEVTEQKTTEAEYADMEYAGDTEQTNQACEEVPDQIENEIVDMDGLIYEEDQGADSETAFTEAEVATEKVPDEVPDKVSEEMSELLRSEDEEQDEIAEEETEEESIILETETEDGTDLLLEDSEAATSGSCGTNGADNVTWKLEDDGTLLISGSGDMDNYAYYLNYLYEMPWSGCADRIRRVVIGEGVTSIGSFAFNCCSNLQEVQMADTVVSVGNDAFRFCTGLETVSFGQKLTSLEESAFFYCISLRTADLPDSLTKLGAGAFEQCASLESIVIPGNITRLENYVFWSCDSLEEVVLPAGLSSMGNRVFGNCGSLAKLTFQGAAPSVSENTFAVKQELKIMCHFSKTGWTEARGSWILPDGTVWYDMDGKISPSEFRFRSDTYSVQEGQNLKLSTTADSYLMLQIHFSVDHPEYLYVAEDGTVTGLKAGTAMVTASNGDGTYQASCRVSVTAASSTAPGEVYIEETADVSSSNASQNNYTRSNRPVCSYLAENEDGTFTRVEYVKQGDRYVVLIADYSGSFALLRQRTIAPELEIFGGYYRGAQYNFLVFGQENPNEDDNCEVVRIVKYSRDWNRLGACQIKGANTYYPFASGTASLTETDGRLFLHTCHLMYQSSDGLHHQANMTFVIDEAQMCELDSYHDVMNIGYGYVSHSFNQLVCTDGKYLYRADHGDAYPRGVVLTRVLLKDEITNVKYRTLLPIAGQTGNNATGVSVGGMELSSGYCLTVGNSVDQSSNDTWNPSGQRNIFLSVADKKLSSSEVIWLTNYRDSDKVTVRTPQLVKLSSDAFLIMWEEERNGEVVTKLMTVSGDGKIRSGITETELRLSDCRPVVSSNGTVSWYVTEGNGNLSVYQINPYSISRSISSCKISLSQSEYVYDHTAKTPGVTVMSSAGTLQEGRDYTVSYFRNVNAGTATVKVTGKGSYTGTAVKQFTIKGKSIGYDQITLGMTCDPSTKKAILPSVTVKDGTAVLVQGRDYNVTYEEYKNGLDGVALVIGTGNYEFYQYKYFRYHTYEESKVIKKATCRTTGIRQYTCEVCNNVYNETISIDPDSHQYAATGKVSSGKVNVKCSLCGKTDKQGVVTSYDCWWNESSVRFYSSAYSSSFKAGSTVDYWFRPLAGGASSYDKDFTVKSSNSKVVAVEPDLNDTRYGRLVMKGGGTATITVYPTLNPGLKKTFTFQVAGQQAITASDITKTASTKTQSFSIKAKAKGNAKLSYKSNNKNVKVSAGGKVTIAKKFVGKAVITITAAKTSVYPKTSKKITITVKPSAASLSGLKNQSGKKMKITWKKNTLGAGYQIQYSLNKNFSGAKTVKIKGNSKTSYTITGLGKGKTYYVRIRTWKTASGYTYYSGWSKSKKVKISK